MFQLVYCSTAVHLMKAHELEEMLHQSRERNAREDITGLLLYHAGGFIQVLEGPKARVHAVFASIQRDSRHHSIHVILKEEIVSREFPSWHMAFRNIRDMSELPEGFSDFLNTPWSGNEFPINPGACQKLLLAVKKSLH